MLFSSITFLFFFLPVTLGLHQLVPRRWKNHVLLAASVVFYASGEPVYIALLAFSALVGWLHGLYMTRHPRCRPALVSAIVFNLAFLLFFKYADFLTGSVNALLGTSIPALGLSLPIGISFYTFQNMSYVLDVYRGDSKAEANFASYTTYLCLFPQLIAGPIVRYSDVARELRERPVDTEQFSRGVVRVAVGLCQKGLRANPNGLLAGPTGPECSVLFSWLRAIAYNFQSCCGFAGYSDMAVGMGAMMGFRFPENFDYPYLSRSVTEFWRRWHMTLGGWFRDYVYIPLGGSRVSRWKWVRNVLVVWMLTGIWHGASWNFLLWGLYYGLFLLAEKLLWGKYLKGTVFPHVYVLLATVLGFVLFHSATASDALAEIGRMFGLGGLPVVNATALYYLRSYAVLSVLCALGSTPWPARWARKLQVRGIGTVLQPLAVGACLVLVTACLVDGSFNPFLYFRF